MSNTCPTCGAAAKTGPRSISQHRRFFGVIKAAYMHWPEASSRQFSSEEELRKFLQMKVGHREIAARIPLTGIRKEQAIILAEAAIRAAGSYAVAAVHGDDLIIWKPKSISFHNLSHLKFCELNTAIDDVLKEELGMSGDELLAEYEAAA